VSLEGEVYFARGVLARDLVGGKITE